MKKIDKNFSHLPEEDAIAATKAMHTAQAQPELRAAFLKEEEKTQNIAMNLFARIVAVSWT